jgi:putative ABC transport system substrate-binding protein
MKIQLLLGLIVSFIGLGIYYEPESSGSSVERTLPVQDLLHKAIEDYSIAIMLPAVHPALDQIKQSFIDTLEKSVSATFTVFNAQGNPTLMRAQAQQVVHEKYDLIFTVGAHCSLMAQEVTLKKQQHVPIVFAAVSNPEKINLTSANVTGATQENQYEEQCRLMLRLKPDTRSVLLVYNPMQGSGLAADKESIEQLLKTHNVQLKTLEVDSVGSLKQKVACQLSHADVVMVLKDNTVVSGIDTLILLCNQARVVLYVSDLDSGAKGAALSYGIEEKSFGQAAAHLAQKILGDLKQPYELPIIKLNNFRVRINRKTMALQNLVIEKELLFLIESGELL